VTEDDRVYRRPLPGGGYVAIESTPDASGDATVHAHVLVERRSDPGRRVGHVPPVVAEAVAPDVQRAVDELKEIAANNVEVARALQRWQAARRADEGDDRADGAPKPGSDPGPEAGPGPGTDGDQADGAQ
jgi:hypothetical protein